MTSRPGTALRSSRAYPRMTASRSPTRAPTAPSSCFSGNSLRYLSGGIAALQQIADGPEAAAVMDGHAVKPQPVIMLGRAIALVAAPIVARMLVMQPRHQP